MRNFGLFNLAALIASLMVLGIAFVLVPEQAWNAESVISIVIFSASVGFVFFVPTILSKKTGASDAAQMATIGPVSMIAGWVFLLTAGAALLALLGYGKIAIAIDIFALGSFVIGSITLSAAVDVVAEVSAKYSRPSNHARWQQDILGLSVLTADLRCKDSLERLADKFRYAPTDIQGGTPYDAELDDAVSDLYVDVENGVVDLAAKIRKSEMLLVKREMYLRSARSKA